MRLPPLIAVRFFEATARHASVRRAAEELHVTPGAVSQQVRKLEGFLGCALFERQPRGLALTAVGRDYQAACAEGLAVIGRATSRIASTNRRQVVLVSCTPGFAVQWLVPRLHGFLQQHPDMDVHVGSTNRAVDLAAEGVQFAVRHGQGIYSGLHSEVLVADDLVPVCSPRLLAPRRTARVADITGPLSRRNRRCVSVWQVRNLGAGRSRVGHPASTATTSAALPDTHPTGRSCSGRPAALPALPRRPALAAPGALPRIPLQPRRTADFSDSVGRARLLHDEHRGDWRLWCEAHGVAGVDCEGGVVFAHNAAIEAAVAGRGFALVRRALVQQELDRRELVSVQCKPLATPLAYHLVYRPEALIDPGLRRFREWIMAQRSAR